MDWGFGVVNGACGKVCIDQVNVRVEPLLHIVEIWIVSAQRQFFDLREQHFIELSVLEMRKT